MLTVQDLLEVAYRGRTIQFDFAAYAPSPNPLALASGASNSNMSFTVSADSDFIWQALDVQCDIDGAALTQDSDIVPLIAVQLTDTTSGRQLFNDTVPLSCFAGNGRQPFYLPVPRLLPAKTVFQLTLTNYSASTNYNVRMAFVGMKVYNLGPSGSVAVNVANRASGV